MVRSSSVDVGRPVDVIGQVGVTDDPDGEAEPRGLGTMGAERSRSVGEAEVAMRRQTEDVRAVVPYGPAPG